MKKQLKKNIYKINKFKNKILRCIKVLKINN